MSSEMAITGACFGFLTKYFCSTLFHESPLAKPWKYPKYMIIGTVLFSYYDWQRRIWLETLLKTEEKLIKSKKYLQLNQINVGEELLDQNKLKVETFMVSHHNI